MSDEKEFELDEDSRNTASEPKQHTGSANSVGEILRKKRVTKRVTIETIAKDLKLSESYIEAIEANDYDKLPADPYVRVYVKSIAKYLMLDPNEILATFLEEKGLNQVDKSLDDSNKLDINVAENGSASQFNPIYIIAIILALILISFLTNRDKIFNKDITVVKADSSKTKFDSSEAKEQEYYDYIQAIPPDSTQNKDSLSVDSAKTVVKDSVKATVIPEKKNSSDKKLSLLITAKKKDVWVRVFADGKSWTSTLKSGKSKRIEANDSLNINVGNNLELTYNLNGKPLTVNGNGVKYFRILPNEKLYYWSSTRWKTVFEGRI